jgi:predicted methyltransferase
LSDVVGPSGHIYGIENAKWDDGSDAKVAAAVKDRNVSIQSVKFGDFNLPEKVDLFWITQNYHDLHIAKYGVVDMAAFNRHANPGTGEAQIAALHRIQKSQVIREVEAAGFKLAAEGDALQRTGDDHTRSVFDPSIRGRTDQFMLKFVKP